MATGERGFTLLGVLFLVVGLGIGLAALGTMWHTAAQREKERELLFIGDQYRKAIDSFWRAEAGGGKRLPKDFKELLSDPRFPNKVRHLRRIYRDPMTRDAEWGVVRGPDGGISGVYSLSEGSPLKMAGFAEPYTEFEKAKSYREWVFVFREETGEKAGGEGSEAPQKPAPQTTGSQVPAQAPPSPR